MQTFENNEPEELKLDFARKQKMATGKLVLLTILTNSNHFVVYAPSLNLSGYGNTEPEATDMFFYALNDYFNHLSQLNQRQVMAEIKQYGWVRKPFLAKQLRNIKFIDEKAILEDFDLPASTPVRRALVTV